RSRAGGGGGVGGRGGPARAAPGVGGAGEVRAVAPAAVRDEHGPHLGEDPVEPGLAPAAVVLSAHSSHSSSSWGATSSSRGESPTTSRSTPHSGQLMISPLSTSYSSISISASHSGHTAMNASSQSAAARVWAPLRGPGRSYLNLF